MREQKVIMGFQHGMNAMICLLASDVSHPLAHIIRMSHRAGYHMLMNRVFTYSADERSVGVFFHFPSLSHSRYTVNSQDFLERLKKKQHSPGFVPPKVDTPSSPSQHKC